MGRRSAVTDFRCRIAVSSCLVVWTLTSAAAAQNAARGPSNPHDTISVVQLRVPDKARDQFSKALSEFSRGHIEEALKRADAALAIAPRFPNALTLRGYIKLKQQQYESADLDFVRSIEIDPTFVLTFLYHGAALNRVGKYDEALINLNHYNDINATSWETHYEMSKSWMGKHDYEHTLTAINQASLLGADREVAPAVHFLRGRALAGLHQYAAARVELEASITPQTSAPMIALAREVLSSIDQETAVASK
ncbi:TPR repeat protein [Candidatus Koribacter versatilis Ellin345]|uniref:TPR repeat protein n=1 Tax=Koribacter versatilis (strain Ellin345) TaxID=204669 RepID=Q1IQQ5_KORVE|nr:hypothetical protein [Candidatus Koribacter versatilis]ABF40795.1 TPR repeat protein [Candidatus Koribacter versatilis Ellin345]